MAQRESIQIPLGNVTVGAYCTVPPQAIGLVLFAHGSGSSRHSPRNQFVAGVLEEAGLATVLLDLLTEDESTDRSNVFDIDLLAERLVAATKWAATEPRLSRLAIGYFGASTGAAAALYAAAKLGQNIRAVVSRGGRPDLADDYLPQVTAPTLLIVGGHDYGVIELNQQAFARLDGAKDLAIVPRATHLFEEPGALEEVADLARDWFVRYLSRPLRAEVAPSASPPPM